MAGERGIRAYPDYWQARHCVGGRDAQWHGPVTILADIYWGELFCLSAGSGGRQLGDSLIPIWRDLDGEGRALVL